MIEIIIILKSKILKLIGMKLKLKLNIDGVQLNRCLKKKIEFSERY